MTTVTTYENIVGMLTKMRTKLGLLEVAIGEDSAQDFILSFPKTAGLSIRFDGRTPRVTDPMNATRVVRTECRSVVNGGGVRAVVVRRKQAIEEATAATRKCIEILEAEEKRLAADLRPGDDPVHVENDHL